MRWAVLLVLLGLAAGRPLFAGPPAERTAIERCAREADPSLRGIDALEHRCPGIEAEVRELGLDPLLPAEWQKTASAQALADLAALADRYAAPALAHNPSLDAARLRSIAATLQAPTAPLSLWDRLLEWLRQWLEPKSDGASSWLRFLPHWTVTPRLARFILEALAALIVLAVAALVVYELKASGLIGGDRPRRTARRTTSKGPPSGSSALDFDALDSAAPREQPALLLRLLVRALTRSRRLGNDRDLTCRELIGKAHFDTPQQREQFAQVALLAERAVYGDPLLAPPAVPQEMLKEARALHAELLAAPRLAPTTS